MTFSLQCLLFHKGTQINSLPQFLMQIFMSNQLKKAKTLYKAAALDIYFTKIANKQKPLLCYMFLLVYLQCNYEKDWLMQH